MENCSLHLLDLELVTRYVGLLQRGGDPAVLGISDGPWTARVLAEAHQGYGRARAGSESGANAVSYGLAQLLATATPTFVINGVSLTSLEARIDRGVGMLMRPPSRLFVDAGFDIAAARAMPIRLDLSRGLMGGGFIPARLVPDLEQLLENRLHRFLRRLIESELDGVVVVGALLTACAAAKAAGMGLFEAMDVVTPEAPEADPPGAEIYLADRRRLEKGLRQRLEAAARPPKQPGLIGRLFGRSSGS